MEYLPVKKVGLLSKRLENDYVNHLFHICEIDLWKTPVDNSVEIVEKSRFSTGISGFWTLPFLWRTGTSLWTKWDKYHNRYVTSPLHTRYLPVETLDKSSAFVQRALFFHGHAEMVGRFFVNVRQSPSHVYLTAHHGYRAHKHRPPAIPAPDCGGGVIGLSGKQDPQQQTRLPHGIDNLGDPVGSGILIAEFVLAEPYRARFMGGDFRTRQWQGRGWRRECIYAFR